MHKGHFFADYSSTIPVLPIFLKLRQDTASEHKKRATHTTPHPETHMYFYNAPSRAHKTRKPKNKGGALFTRAPQQDEPSSHAQRNASKRLVKKGGHKPSGITPCIRRSSRHQFWRRFPVQTWRDRQTCSARFYPAASTVH